MVEVYIITMKNLDVIRGLIRQLEAMDAPTRELWVWLDARERAKECCTPTESDRAWPLIAPVSIEEHLTGDTRPVLSCAMAQGRAYTLDEAQRQVIAEWYRMTCSPTVVVAMLATFPGEPTLVREVIIKSEQHVDPQNLRLLNGPRSVTIDRWGDFCTACAVRRVENADRRELDAMTSRVERLFKRAKAEGVHHRFRSPGNVSHEWHARVVQRRVEGRCDVSPEVSRDLLRDVLALRGEPRLAELVKEPTPQGGVKEDMRELDEEMDKLLASLGVKL